MRNNLSTKQIREIFYFLFELNFSIRQTSQRLGITRESVAKYKVLFEATTLLYEQLNTLADDDLINKLFPIKVINSVCQKAGIDFDEIHHTMQTQKNATIKELHAEWLKSLAVNDIPISYSQFNKRYSDYRKSLKISLRHQYTPGEAVFVDYSGMTMPITNSHTGEIKQAQIFIGVLGYSNYTFCEATSTQNLQDWVMSHSRMFQFFDGIPQLVVHDNLKSAVTKPHLLYPVLNLTYENMCSFFNIHALPARVYKPKDKPKAEAGVLLVQRWILFRLRKRQFFSITELNQAIAPLLIQLNNKSFQKIKGSRFSRYQETEKQKLQALPTQSYEYSYWGTARAGLDYHIVIEGHGYSVPYMLRNKSFQYCISASLVRLYYQHKLVATHIKTEKSDSNTFTTIAEHRSPNHQAIYENSPENIINWASNIGVFCKNYFENYLNTFANQYQRYRFFQGFKKLVTNHEPKIVELICEYALKHGILDINTFREIVKNRLPVLLSQEQKNNENFSTTYSTHQNIRGKDYYL